MPPQLLTWGRGREGQLGHRKKQHEDVPSPAPVEALGSRPVLSVACGGFHTAAVVGARSNAEVHTWGRGALGLLGHGIEEDVPVPRPVRALAGISVRAVSCGTYQTAALTEAGEVYTWGWRLDELPGGRGVQEGYSTLPERVHALAQVQLRHVACGHYAVAATSVDGALYTWGNGDRGQLGHGHTRSLAEPSRVAALRDSFVWDARFGRNFLLALTAAGELYTCGASDGGVLGHGRPAGGRKLLGLRGAADGAEGAGESTPRRIEGLRGLRASAIGAGDEHCAAVVGDGEVYCWGVASFGRLGFEPPEEAAWTPTVVAPMRGKRVVGLACGTYTTLARTDAGHVWEWGAHSVHPTPPTRVRFGGTACAVGAAGGHCAVAIGAGVLDAADLALARSVGFEPPPSTLGPLLP